MGGSAYFGRANVFTAGERRMTTTEKIRQEMLKHPSPAIAQVVMYDQGKCDVINAAKPIVEELSFCAAMISFFAILAWTIVNLNRGAK